MNEPIISRRGVCALGAAVGWSLSEFNRQAFGERPLRATPPLTEGPFYPDRLPLDRDNDLIFNGDRSTPAAGTITNLTGRILTASGQPVADALVEIWQCDARGVYLHTADSGRRGSQPDTNFQGYGGFETPGDGGYRFRTIKPVAYPGRPAPHIHFKISRGGRELLTTQLLIRGHRDNERDGVFRTITDPAGRESVTADFEPAPGTTSGELACRFDIVLGRTPAMDG